MSREGSSLFLRGISSEVTLVQVREGDKSTFTLQRIITLHFNQFEVQICFYFFCVHCEGRQEQLDLFFCDRKILEMLVELCHQRYNHGHIFLLFSGKVVTLLNLYWFCLSPSGVGNVKCIRLKLLVQAILNSVFRICRRLQLPRRPQFSQTWLCGNAGHWMLDRTPFKTNDCRRQCTI